MGRLGEFRRRLEEIQKRRLAMGGGTSMSAPPRAIGPVRPGPARPAAPRPAAPPVRSPRWSPFLQSVLQRAARIEPPQRRGEPVRLEAACPGRVAELPGVGRVWVMDYRDAIWDPVATRLVEALESGEAPVRERLGRRLGRSDVRAADLFFVDIETTGLSNTPLFLIGTLRIGPDGAGVRQYLARDYSEERAALELFLAECPKDAVYVSFNGKAFDLPYIRVRLAYHRVPWRADRPHFDVLHEARRTWRGEVPNCRLTTLESWICGRLRTDDIEGALIPDAYHRFVRTGDAVEIVQVVRHNRLDLWTMADLMTRMPPEQPAAARGDDGPAASPRSR